VHVLENRRVKLTLQWDCQHDQWFHHYVVEYRDDQSSQWNEIVARDRRFQFTNLRHRTSYQFRVACRTIFGRGSFSPEVGPFTVRSICDAPQFIRQVDITDTSLSLTWEDPPLEDGISISRYVVSYWPQQQKSALHQVTCHQKFCTLDGLDADKVYVIQLMAECGSLGTGSASEPVEIRTNADPDRLACILREVSQLSTEDPAVNIYQIPLEEKTVTKGIRRFQLGRGINKNRRKTILVVGPTGSGKTTFINALLNHMVGVRWEDDFRLKLIQEPAKTQAFSQTQNVTVYDIFRMKGSNLDYSLTIVDTPGFGDTRGLERDKMIIEQIRQYFQSPDGVLGLEAVCFLLEASLARLTHTQKYIYDSILSLFGKDIKDNIRLMITFADNREPRVLSSIRASDIPYTVDDRGRIKYHKFNNSSLFVPVYTQDAQEDFFNKVLYEMTGQSFRQFLADLATMQTTSLMLTKEVLLERRRLEAVVEGLQLRIQHGLDRMEEFNQIRNALSEQEQRMDLNENSQFQVTFSVPEEKDISGSGHYVTNCQKCKTTCHYPCSQANDSERFKCSVMDSTGRCRVCPEKCQWNEHFNQKFRYELVKRTETRSVDAIRQQYQVAANEKLSKQQLLQRLAKELESYEKNVMDLVNMTYPSIKRLDEIALKPHPFSAPEYIDMIIEAELLEGETGYKKRIESLKKLKQMAEIQSKMISGQPLFDSKSFVSSETNPATLLSHSTA
jgi:predicted GTPase